MNFFLVNHHFYSKNHHFYTRNRRIWHDHFFERHFLVDSQLGKKYKITQSSQRFIDIKKLKMKLYSTILASFSAIHGFNTGIQQKKESRLS